MLEYFSPPTGPPPESGGQLARTGGLVTAPPGSADTDDAMFAPLAGTGDTSTWALYGPASRPVAKRTPVSGTPPWEPASPPGGVLPWSDPGEQMIAGQVVASGAAADESEPADPNPRPLRRPDWRRAVVSGIEPSGSVQPEWDAPALRPSPPVAPHPPSPAGGQAAGNRPDLSAPAAWWGGAGAGSTADWDPDARPSGQPRHADSGQHRSGLPIRQPRSISQTPRSASGSLWEPAAGSRLPSDGGERLPDAGSPPTRPDDDRPIFVWEPSGAPADTEARRPAD
jgi:hypothetical protein